MSDGEIAELMAMVDLTNGLNKFLRAAGHRQRAKAGGIRIKKTKFNTCSEMGC